MDLEVKGMRLLFDGFLPCDSLSGDSYMQLFSTAKPILDYAFKVERPGYILVWQFDRYLFRVMDESIVQWLDLGRFYPKWVLKSESDLQVAEYLEALGWQVRVTKLSIDRQEFLVLAIFSAQGAILEEAEEFSLLSLTAHEEWPLVEPEPLRVGREPLAV